MSGKYLTVTALTRYIKQKLETDIHLKDVWLKGEISNFNHHSRGHMYFTIKDERSSIRAVMFASANRHLKFTPENGMKVFLRGEIGVFEPYGQYQLYVQQMEPDGIGALHLAYEQLKEKLAQQGLFDEQHKKELPRVPKHIGIITSPTGAAVRDMITTIRRRYPLTKITVIPAIVQGEMGAKSIQDAIEKANELDLFDLLIVGRGGGSIEDLWNFNEEEVARSIFTSKTPIISAVGHETDHTIADYVADVRAPTPTAAAEIAVPDRKELQKEILRKQQLLHHLFQTKLNNFNKHLQHLKQSYAFRYPEQLVKQKEQELDRLNENLRKGLSKIFQQKGKQYEYIQSRLISLRPKEQVKQIYDDLKLTHQQLNRSMEHYIKEQQQQMTLLLEKLTLLNPLNVIKRGFTITYSEKGEIVSSKKQVKQGDLLNIQVQDGEISCEVLDLKGEGET